MKNRVAAFRILLILIVLSPNPTPVFADIAPPPIPMMGGLGQFEYQSTNVQMVSERVEMELGPVRYVDEGQVYYHPQIVVNAWFVMHNTSNQDETMQVVFPQGNMDRCSGLNTSGLLPSYTYLNQFSYFEAQVNGDPVETTSIKTSHPYCRKEDGFEMEWSAFNVTFPANDDVVIRVSYLWEYMGGGDSVFNVGYTLETGAAWKGPIGEAIIVFRFPYVVADDFIMQGTTSGYQIMQNEIYWRYEDIEPAHEDNINIAFINYGTWDKIRDSRHRIKINVKDDVAWAQLAESYSDIAHYHGPSIRSKEYNQRAYAAYREGLKANPFSSWLNAGYTDLYLTDCCFYDPISDTDLNTVLPFIKTALQADPSNEKALEWLNRLQTENPKKDFSVGPTFTPNPAYTPTGTQTATSTFISFDLSTPQPTRTQTVTVLLTSTKPLTSTLTSPPPSVTVTPKLVSTAVQGEDITSKDEGGSIWIIGAVLIAVGCAIFWWQMKSRRQS